jgi:hypothetical protein
MPGAREHRPGWRRRGCRRRLRTARIARSRRSATRQSRRAGRVRCRHEGLPRQHGILELLVLPAAECALGQEAVPDPLQGQRAGAAGATPGERVGGRCRKTSPGKVLLRGCNGASSPARSKMSASRVRPSSRIRRAVTVLSAVGRFGQAYREDRPKPAPFGGSPVRPAPSRWPRNAVDWRGHMFAGELDPGAPSWRLCPPHPACSGWPAGCLATCHGSLA